MNDSREIQDVESICSGKLSHVPSHPAIVPSLCGILSRDQSLRPETWNLLGTSGNVFDSPLAPIDSSSTPFRGMFHSWNLHAADGIPVRDSTGRPVPGSDERNRDTIPTPRFARRPSTMNSLFPTEGAYPQNYMADQQRLQISELQFDKFHTFNVFMLEDKIRFKNAIKCLFWFSLGGDVLDQRSGDGQFSGFFLNRTPSHTSHFLVFVRTHDNVSLDIGSCVCARHPNHVSCACVFDLSSTLSLRTLHLSPPSSTSSS